jgi:hypothetical protein
MDAYSGAGKPSCVFGSICINPSELPLEKKETKMASQHGASKTATGAKTAAAHAAATAAKTAGKNTAAEIHRRPWSAELLLAVDAVPHVTPRRPAGHQQAKQRR